MDTITIIVGGALLLLIAGFIIRLCYTIASNLINGRKFHHALEQQFNQLRLSNMLSALGINKTAYIYQVNANEIKKQMNSCSECNNTAECDEKLSTADIDINNIDFCNNEADLKKLKQQQSESE